MEMSFSHYLLRGGPLDFKGNIGLPERDIYFRKKISWRLDHETHVRMKHVFVIEGQCLSIRCMYFWYELMITHHTIYFF